MPSLRETQSRFAHMLLSGDVEAIKPDIVDYGPWTEARCAVYRNNVLASLTEALADTFPVIKRLVGDGFFAYAAHEFIRRAPPRVAMLSEFGRDFPAFLDTFPPAAGHPYLGDVARLEFAWLEAYHAPDAAPLSPLSLQGVAPMALSTVRLLLHPSRRFIVSEYPVASIWQANGPDGDGRADLAKGEERVLVIRPRQEVEVRILTPAVHAFLSALDTDRNLTEAFEAALAVDGAFDLQHALQSLMAGETFAGFELADCEAEGEVP